MGYFKTIILVLISIFFFSSFIYSYECNIDFGFDDYFNQNPDFEINSVCEVGCNISLYNYEDINIENKFFEKKYGFDFDFDLKDGKYYFDIICFNNSFSKNSTHFFEIDSNPPMINPNISYSEDEEFFVLENHEDYRDVEISFKTDKESKCTYNGKNIFSDNSLYHKFEKSLSSGEYNYSINCIDDFGNENDLLLNFKILKKPYVNISFNENMPFKEGLYNLKLTSSRDLKESPTLRYSYDQNNFNTIALTGSNDEWEGYIQIDDSNSEKVGSFKVSIEDIYGIKGNLIKENEIFLVDTREPPKIDDISSKSTVSGVRLDWYYPHDFDSFNIYRSDSGVPSKLDFYDSTDSFSYLDENVSYNGSYYYFVSPVDKAGNEGEFSDLLETEGRDEEETELSDRTINILSDLSNDLRLIENNIDSSIKLYNDLNDDVSYRSILEGHNYFDKIINYLSKVRSLQENISNLNDGKYNDSKTYELSLDISSDIDGIRSHIFTDLEIIDEIDSNLEVSETYLSSYLNDFVERMRITDEDLINKYVNYILDLNRYASFDRSIKLIEISFLDDNSENYLFYNDKVSISGDFNYSDIYYYFKIEEYLINGDVYSSDCSDSTFHECDIESSYNSIKYSFPTSQSNINDALDDVIYFISGSSSAFDSEVELVDTLSSQDFEDDFDDESDSVELDKNLSDEVNESDDLNESGPPGLIRRTGSVLTGFFIFDGGISSNNIFILIGSLLFISLLGYYLYLEFSDDSINNNDNIDNFDSDLPNFKSPSLKSKNDDSNHEEISNLLREAENVLDGLDKK